MSFEEMCRKEVISVKDCRKLGHVVDLEFDEYKGSIRKIIVAQRGGIANFFWCGEEIAIPFCNIKQIGPDIILADYCG